MLDLKRECNMDISALTRVEISIPDGISFDSLGLELDDDGSISFDIETLEAVAFESGIDVALLDEDYVLQVLLISFYQWHRVHDGELNRVMEDIIAQANDLSAYSDDELIMILGSAEMDKQANVAISQIVH
ncbi:MAG: hypothetical protein ACI935_000715 [Moritella dasanensis]|jgi:hypothetical protein